MKPELYGEPGEYVYESFEDRTCRLEYIAQNYLF